MCTGSKSESCNLGFNMECESRSQLKKDITFNKNCSKLLVLSAEDDIIGFLSEIVQKGCDANELSVWYGKRIGSMKMCFDERTPLLIAAVYGSIKVLKYILENAKFDVNKAYGLDGVTALHCAASGGSEFAVETVEMLIEAGGDINCVDANGFKPTDIVGLSFKSLNSSKRKKLEMLLKGIKTDVIDQMEEELQIAKAEFTVDETLPNINKGIYATDEFRMYSFKITPCSRAYSHVWIDCPFVHPGENARRRDPRKHTYTCVPCPEFKRGTCSKRDACEYAHGVFESLLHPAQYRTRRCKDDTTCLRKVCFFAHKPEELRPLYASTGSAMPTSPFTGSNGSMDIGSLSPLALNSPMTQSIMGTPSPMGTTNMWQNNLSPPALHLPGSRLKSNISDFETNVHGFESIHMQQQNRHLMLDEMSLTGLASPWDFNPLNNDGILGSPDYNLQSPNEIQMMRNTSHPLRASYPSNIPSPSPRNSRLSPFGNGSKSFNDHASSLTAGIGPFGNGSISFNEHASSVTAAIAADSPSSMSSNMSDWGWVFNTDELNKLGKSESFGITNGGKNAFERIPSLEEEPDVSWVRSLVKDSEKIGSMLDKMPSWFDNLPLEHEQMVA